MTAVAVRLWPWLLSLAIAAPMLLPGFVLSYDMVFVPDQAVRADYFGLAPALPRAIPSDALVSIASLAVPGQILQKAILLGLLVAAGAGVRKVLATASAPAQVVAISWYIWNPFVAERLVLGQWAVLVGYSALPWVLALSYLAREGSRRAAGGAVIAVVIAAVTASGGVVAAALGCGVLLTTGGGLARRDRIAVTVGMLAANAPWIVAGVLQSERAVSGLAAVEAFAARGEGHLPAPLAGLGLGGVWNSEVVLDSRSGWLPVVWLAMLLLLVVAGIPHLERHVGRAGTLALGAVALAGYVVAMSGVVAPHALGDLTTAIPGAALFRDGTRYLGPLALIQALALGLGAARLAARLRQPTARGFVVVGLSIAPVVVMPDLAWGAAGRLEPVSYPETWAAARQSVVDDGNEGTALYVPLAPYRAFSWNESRPVLDPAPRYFPSNALVSDALRVDGRLVQAEEPRAAEAMLRLRAGDADGLRALGVGYVVATADLTKQHELALGAGLRPLFVSTDIEVYVVDDAVRADIDAWQVLAMSCAWVAYGAAIGLGVWLRVRREGGVQPAGVKVG